MRVADHDGAVDDNPSLAEVSARGGRGCARAGLYEVAWAMCTLALVTATVLRTTRSRRRGIVEARILAGQVRSSPSPERQAG